MNKIRVKLTKEEQKAIASLKRLAKKFPSSLKIFGWSGSMCVFKVSEEGYTCEVGSVPNIRCDGGDPNIYLGEEDMREVFERDNSTVFTSSYVDVELENG